MTLNVVVVDDETPICEWLVYCIQKASPDYQVSSALNGDDAYALILKQKPDVVFTDIRMPGMDGLELMRSTLEVLPFTTFAILTNHAEFTYAKQALSLGAKEYFLKSELRAADIEGLLLQIWNKKMNLLQAKTNEVFSSGCIDLYLLYQNREESDFADKFWEQQGMYSNIPYQLICLPSHRSLDEWRRLAGLAEKVRLCAEGKVYAAAANEQDHSYLIIQSDYQLARQTTQLVNEELGAGNAGIGVSSVLCQRGDFLTALQESAVAQAASFFCPDRPVIQYDEVAAWPPLERGRLISWQKRLLAMISQRRYSEANEGIRAWFEDMAKPGAQDIAWAVDACKRMVLSVEERYYLEMNISAKKMVFQTTVQQCADRCKLLLEKLDSDYSEKYSPPIAAALEYIHQHYGEDISMAGAAHSVYRSVEYFSRQFKTEVGENFNTYLTLYRLERAQELLRGTDLRVVEIAEKVGYTTPGYFSRLYKRYKGVTPERDRMSK